MKKIVSLLLSLCMIFSFATICYADDETVIPPVSNEMIINPYLRSTATFGSCKIDQGVTMGFASGDNGWAIAANTTVTLKFYMKTKESNVNCGYYRVQHMFKNHIPLKRMQAVMGIFILAQ